ncbi:MAG: helicase C-terminal domain-containing protein [Gemmatimonadota bacterium]|jgi:ATP-dependent DNA helicase DinG
MPRKSSPSSPPPPLRLTPEAALHIREEILRARGREVTFLLEVTGDRSLHQPRAVARGNRGAVLAVARDAPQGTVMIHNHPSGDLEPSAADLAVAATLYESGLGTAIVNNEASEIYVVVEPPEPRVVEPLELERVEAFLAPGGALSRTHRTFEDRPGQREMALLVSRRFNEGGVGMVEAGTGTGKSMAYLLPAALWALQNGERTVISTNTINLQEQLVGKDLPALKRALGEEGEGVAASGEGIGGGPGGGSAAEPGPDAPDLRWALVKGRGNYVSIRRAHLAAETAPSLFDEDRSQELQGILDWIETTEDGSLSDLASPPSEDVWEEVQSDADICLRTRCPHFQECFFQRARRAAASAEILVVNHHLLFTDLAVRRATDNFTQAAVLPPYRHLILDEAHNVEEAATDHLGVEVTRRGLFRSLSRLDRRGKGVLADIREKLASDPDRGTAGELLARMEDRVGPALEEARSRIEPFLSTLTGVLQEGESQSVRLGGTDALEPRESVSVRESMDGLVFALSRLGREVGELRVRIQDDEAWAEALEGRCLDLSGAQNRIDSHIRGIGRVLDPGDEGAALVRWIERRGRRPGWNLALAAAPIEVGPALRDDLFRRLETTVLTSATLTTRAGFEYLRERLGLGASAMEEEGGGLGIEEAVVPSPFDFPIQALLAIPTDLAGPQEPGDRFQEDTARVALEMAQMTDGGLFVLFTSHAALRRVGELLREMEGGPRGSFFPLFIQGEAPRAKLLFDFVESGRGILLGTASFWEGVDVPGDPLRGLIIQKLPFQVPTEPIIAARLEAIEARGEDPFWRYSLPEAALRLKQGFGRLIRTQDDRGAVLLLDDRILTRRYGSYLRQSLPPAPMAKGLWPDLRRGLEEFYRQP